MTPARVHIAGEPEGLERFRLHFDESDAQKAYDSWHCNCGPSALAAIAGVSLDSVRQYMGEFESKGYTNPKLMFESLDRLGLRWSRSRSMEWPTFGLVRIQWEGPWMEPGVPIQARYRYTHWVGGARLNGHIGVFDINCMNSGGWVSLEDWTGMMAPHIMKHAAPRGNGKWSLATVIEVTR